MPDIFDELIAVPAAAPAVPAADTPRRDIFDELSGATGVAEPKAPSSPAPDLALAPQEFWDQTGPNSATPIDPRWLAPSPTPPALDAANASLSSPLDLPGIAGAAVHGAVPNATGLATGTMAADAALAVGGALGLTNPVGLAAVGLLAGVGGFMGGRKASEHALGEMEKQGDPIVAPLAQAAREHPKAAVAGELATLAAPVPGSIAKLADAASIVRAEKGAGAAARFIAQQVASGAAVGVGTDALMRGAGQALGWENSDFSPEGTASAAIIGALLSGHSIQHRDYNTAQTAEIVTRGMRAELAQRGTPEGGIVPAEAAPLRPEEQKVYDAVRAQLAAIVASKPKGTEFDPAGAQFTARQVGGFGQGATVAESAVPTRATTALGTSAANPRGPTAPAAAPSPAEPAPAGASASMVPVGGEQTLAVPGQGAPTVIFGSRGAEIPARYAWVPSLAAQASHAGEMLAPNPRYLLTNTRDYSDPAERDKQLDVLQNFDPRRHVTDAADAAVGPSIVGTVIDEQGDPSLQRFGGNSRGFAIQNLPPERRAALRDMENAKAGQFGLEPTSEPDAELVRHLGTFDFRQPGERARAQALVDALNPSPGRVQGTAERAQIDAETVPAELLATVGMDAPPAAAQAFVRGMIEQGHADRNLTSAIAAAPAQAQDYVQRLLVNAAFRQPALAEARSDPRAAGTTVRGMIDAAVPALVQLRSKDAGAAADAIARAFTTTLAYLDEGGTRIGEALEKAAQQTEFDPESVAAREVAQAMRHAIVPDAKGRPLIEPTVANWQSLFATIAGALERHDPGTNLFGEAETPLGALQRAVSAWNERGSALAREEEAPQGAAMPKETRAAQNADGQPSPSGSEAKVIRLGEPMNVKTGEPVTIEALHGTAFGDITEFDPLKSPDYYEGIVEDDTRNNYSPDVAGWFTTDPMHAHSYAAGTYQSREHTGPLDEERFVRFPDSDLPAGTKVRVISRGTGRTLTAAEVTANEIPSDYRTPGGRLKKNAQIQIELPNGHSVWNIHMDFSTPHAALASAREIYNAPIPQYANSRVIRAELRLNNPKVIDLQGGLFYQMGRKANIAMSEGHDGLIVLNVRDPGSNPARLGTATTIAVFKKAEQRTYATQSFATLLAEQNGTPEVPQIGGEIRILPKATAAPLAESAGAGFKAKRTNGTVFEEQSEQQPTGNVNPESRAPSGGAPPPGADAIAQARAEIDAAGADYSPVVFAAKGSPYVNVPLRGLPGIRIVEMPEMVQLVKELGAELLLKKLPKSLGHFDPNTPTGTIRLDPRIFADHVAAAKTMMHEIGHLIDWLPDKSLRRGNLWGRLYSLRKYMQEKFGSSISTRTNKEFRAELIALTQWWKPYDPATSPPSYVKYRESAVELYADFISVLYNSPADAQRLAPKFFREFFRGLDTKPDVKKALLDLQAWLQKPVKQRLADRAANVESAFEKGEAIFMRKTEERKARYAGYRGWLSRVKQAMFDHFAPVRDRAASVGGATGDAIAQLFDGHPLASNEHYRWLEHLHRTVIEPAEAAGFTMNDVGQWLFFDRIANESYPVSARLAESLGSDTGGRTAIANPLGHTPKTARDQLLITRLGNGIRRQTLLDDAVQRFHDAVREVMREAHRAGLITPEQLAIIEQNAQHYAAFTPLEYVDTFVPAGFFHQAGTLKEIANPFISTVLKVLQMQRAIQFQKIKTATVRLLTDYFPGEIERAEVRRSPDGRTATPKPPRERGTAQIMLREAGKPVWFNVPAEVAAMFDRPDVPHLESALAVLDVPFRTFFYPLFITYNPIFQLVRNPIRDARRTYVNAPAGVGFWSIARQLPLIKQLGPNPALDAVRAFIKQGIQTPLIAEMLDNLAITPGEATFTVTAGKPVTAFDKILEQHGLLPDTEQPDAVRRMVGKIGLGKLADAIARVGKINELLPKAAIYRQLRALGWAPADAAFYVRNFIGTPNFSRRGTHIGLVNPIVPFINIWTKGWAADAELARRGFKRRSHPDEPGKSRSSFWLRWAMTSGVWTTLKIAAGVGLFGALVKQLFDGIGSFDKTNYDVLPIGYSGKSDLNPKGKVAYFKLPKDPTDRVLSAIQYNTMNALAIKAAKAGLFGAQVQEMNAGADDRLGVALTRNFSVAAGDVPGLNPLLKISNGWREYAQGQNPIDDFRASRILTDAEFLVGGAAALKPMLAWTIGQTGVQSFLRYDPQAKTSIEITAQNLPIVNGMVRISDYGFREQQMLTERMEDAAGAAARLALPANARQLATEHSFLRGLGAPDRTPEQETRYQQLSAWHSTVWKPAEQQLRDADELQLSPATRRTIIDSAERASRPFER